MKKNKANAYSLWIYTSSAWQGYVQKSEFLLTAWNYMLPMSPSGVTQKEFLPKISSTKGWKGWKVSNREHHVI